MKRLIALTLFALSVHFPLAAATPSVMDHNGVGLMYQSVDPAKKFDTTALPADQGLRNIAKALDALMEESPLSAQKIKSLMKSGRVLLVYHPDNLRDSAAGSESVALFLPDFLKNPADQGHATTFIVVVGRHGVKWPTKELAAVLAHELVGHGVQHQRARLSSLREIDAECEAYMYEEIANQDLGLDKRSREMVVFRQMMEDNYCTDFKTFMRKRQPGGMALWDVLNPNVPKLLSIFETYLGDSKERGVTGKSIAAMKQLIRERRKQDVKDATPEELYKHAIQLRDGAVGVAQDAPEALRYFKLAAERGYAPAQFRLGWIHTKGTGVKKDPAKALAWFQKAAKQGHASAQSRVGWQYMKGVGVTKDYAAARQWFAKAARQKYTLAYYNLGAMHRLGLGVKKDHAAAAKWYRKGAESGHPGSQYRYGWYHYRGVGLAKNRPEAAKWFNKAADKGYAYAQNRLGWMYTQGRGVKKDPVKALVWFKKAAKKGHAPALSRLGWLYMKGNGVKKDYAAAYTLFTKAAAKKNTLAYYNLGSMHRLGLGRAKDPAGAIKWYQKGAARGHAASQNVTGWMLANGNGVKKDQIKAYMWYTLAAAKGHKTARKNLGAISKKMSPADISNAKALAKKRPK